MVTWLFDTSLSNISCLLLQYWWFCPQLGHCLTFVDHCLASISVYPAVVTRLDCCIIVQGPLSASHSPGGPSTPLGHSPLQYLLFHHCQPLCGFHLSTRICFILWLQYIIGTLLLYLPSPLVLPWLIYCHRWATMADFVI